MFAVPGWSLSSGPKRQTEADVQRANNLSNQSGESKTSRKRKRKSGAAAGAAADAAAADRTGTKQVSSQFKESTPRNEPDHESNAERTSKKSKKAKRARKDGDPGDGEQPSEKPATASAPKTAAPPASANPAAAPVATSSSGPAPALTPLQQKMRHKLISARFRHLNETLYTTPSSTSAALLAESPSTFADYHAGFRQQVSVWPENPLEVFLMTLRERAGVKDPSRSRWRKAGAKDHRGEVVVASEVNGGPAEVEALPRRKDGTCTVADLGCGEGELGRRMAEGGFGRRRKVKVLGYDLASPNEFVIKADVAKLPLKDGEVNVAVFCLALMGTNWIEFVEEAWRVLRWKGELWVAEIKSRFARPGGKGGRAVVEHSVGKKRNKAAAAAEGRKKEAEERERREEAELREEVDGVAGRGEETDVSGFVEVLARRGFVLRKGQASVDLSNKMFVRMEFIKAATPTAGRHAKAEGGVGEKTGRGKRPMDTADEVDVEAEAKVLKPCLYKVR